MKVALLTNFIPPYRKSLYSALSRHLDSLTVFVSQNMEKNRDWEVDHGDLNVVVQKGFRYTKKWKSDHSKNYESTVQIPYDTFFKLKKNKPDVVISVEMGVRSLLASIYCIIYKKPLLIWLALSEHSEKDKKGMRILLRKLILKCSSGILCNGKSAERYVKSLNKNKKVFYIPCTSDFKLSENMGKKKASKRILITGQLIERKGIKETVNALENWALKNKNTNVIITVAGDGPERTKLERLNQFSNIDLQLLGTIPYDEIQHLYIHSNLYLFPTLGDEWGVVVNEAMASTLPVIGSIYSQAVEELIEHGKNGWKFDPKDKQKFSKTLTEAINTPPEILKKMGHHGKNTIQKYTPEIVSERIMEAIKLTLL